MEGAVSFIEKTMSNKTPVAAKPLSERSKDYYRAKPSGEIDYDALAKDVKRRFPKILAHLAE